MSELKKYRVLSIGFQDDVSENVSLRIADIFE